ncbi:transporter substrate-binding domain-containing protein [Chromobacterium paludis]|uniref:Transporter substrate-binding domain-containing protein n=2 Tax=Chromobacterium paludis TaxID=2605945 RepID=A0A5C1DBU3_9NEIS|nr:transporter substrate-binding domain-containing protein [Chromobacterium paludis]QEL57725.1 transporter substrate-binding domain-containing protein [Chromobacterium paludis]
MMGFGRRSGEAILAMSLALLVAPSEAQVLRLLATEWPPYCGEALPGGGRLVRSVRTAFRQAGYQTEVRVMPWKRALASLASGEADGLIGAEQSSSTPAAMAVSVELMQDREYLFSRQTERAASAARLEVFRGKRVGVMRGSVVPELRAVGMLVEEANNDEANLRKLQLGRLDLMLANADEVEHLVANEPALAQRIQRLEPPIYRNPLYLLLSRRLSNWPKVMSDFNAAWERGEAMRTIEK